LGTALLAPTHGDNRAVGLGCAAGCAQREANGCASKEGEDLLHS